MGWWAWGRVVAVIWGWVGVILVSSRGRIAMHPYGWIGAIGDNVDLRPPLLSHGNTVNNLNPLDILQLGQLLGELTLND